MPLASGWGFDMWIFWTERSKSYNPGDSIHVGYLVRCDGGYDKNCSQFEFEFNDENMFEAQRLVHYLNGGNQAGSGPVL